MWSRQYDMFTRITFDSPNLQDSFNLALFCGIHEKYAMWKFIIDVVNDFVSSLQPDLAEGFYTSPTCSCYISLCHLCIMKVKDKIISLFNNTSYHAKVPLGVTIIKVQGVTIQRVYLHPHNNLMLTSWHGHAFQILTIYMYIYNIDPKCGDGTLGEGHGWIHLLKGQQRGPLMYLSLLG